MNRAYLSVNLEDLEVGDSVKVATVWKVAKKQLTKGKVYKIIALRYKNGRSHPSSRQFCIVTDTGDQRWYYWKNRMFELHSKKHAYSEEQLRLMKEFVRVIESLVMAWRSIVDDNPDADTMYEKDRDSSIVEYLEKLNLAK